MKKILGSMKPYIIHLCRNVFFFLFALKGQYVVLKNKIQTENFSTYIINEVIIIQSWRYLLLPQLINKLLSEENKVPRTLFEARKVAGSATCKTE